MRTQQVDGHEVLFFADAAEWAAWLDEHHDRSAGIWMGLAKKHVTPRGLQWADAVVEALRYGWIDSQVRRIDEDFTRQRWTPRKPGSQWSAVNVATAERLVEEGRMAPAGLAAFQARRVDDERHYSFEADAAGLTPDHQAILAADPLALAFWEATTPTYRKACSHWVGQAKQPATRDRRLAQLVQCCADGELVPFQRYGTPPSWLARARAARDRA